MDNNSRKIMQETRYKNAIHTYYITKQYPVRYLNNSDSIGARDHA